MPTALIVIPLVLFALLLGTILIMVPRRRALVAINETDFPGLSRLRFVTNMARIIGLLAGIVVVAIIWLVRDLGRSGLSLFLAPAIFALTQIIATLVAGVLTHDAAKTLGTAGLEVRRVGSYLPRRLSALIAATTVVLALALTWTSATGVSDSMGHGGREFSFEIPGEAAVTATIGPWPGSFYSVPLAVALGLVLVVAGIAIIVTIRRPRNASDPEIVRVDDLVRARAVESVLAAVGVAMAGTLFCVSVLVATLAIPQNLVPDLLRLAGWSAVTLEAAAMAITIWCGVLLLLPGAGTRLGKARGRAQETAAEASGFPS